MRKPINIGGYTLPVNKWEKRFLFDLVTDSTSVPNVLLKYYHQLGLTESDLIFLIQLMMFGGQRCPSVTELSQCLNIEVFVVKQNFASLIEKGIIVPETVIESGDRVLKYYFDGLYDKLMDIWACEMVGKDESAVDTIVEKSDFGLVYRAFEKEFGRPLSPIENDKIGEWLDTLGYKPEVVLESLKRAILRGVYNFNYIDKILIEWHKSNIRTVEEIINYERIKMSKGKTVRKKEIPNQSRDFKHLYEI